MKISENNVAQLHTEKYVKEIFAKQVSQLYSAITFALVAALVNALLLVLVLLPVIDHVVLLTWFSLFTLIFIARGITAYKYKLATHSAEGSPLWYQRYLVGSMLSATVWGSASIWLFPAGDLIHQVFLAFVLGGISAGAITSMSYTKATVYSFILLSLSPIVLRFYFSDLDLSVVMGFLLTLYLLMLLISAKRANALNELSISLQFESVDQKNALQVNEDRYKKLLETATDAFYLHDQDGRIIDVNNQSSLSLGYSHDELLTMSVSDIDAGPKTDVLKENWERLSKGEKIQIESIHRRKDGSTFPVEANIGLIQINNKNLLSVLVRDITERKRIDKLKNEFISTVSHELRTPLTSIKGALGLINGGVLGELPSKTAEILKIAGNNTERLLLIINDILDIQKYESGQFVLNTAPVDVMTLVNQSIAENSAYGDAYNVNFILTNELKDVKINADKNRLLQVMANLLSNAAKFSHENQNVEITLNSTSDNTVRISVKDFGQGIPEAFKSKVFERFTQFDSSDTRSKGGTGLGLSITKVIVEKHGGKIDFISEEGKGATFFIEIPIFIAK